LFASNLYRRFSRSIHNLDVVVREYMSREFIDEPARDLKKKAFLMT
jgi:hypothetical protein